MVKLFLTSSLFRKAVSYSLLGFLVITLVGPIVAILGTLLGFAIIGLITWPLVRVTWLLVVGSGDKAKQPAVAVSTPAPAHCEKRPCAIDRPHRRAAWRWLGDQTRFAGGVLFEVACGALVGASLGLLAGWNSASPEQYLGISAAVGAFLGILVGKTGREPAPEPKPAP